MQLSLWYERPTNHSVLTLSHRSRCENRDVTASDLLVQALRGENRVGSRHPHGVLVSGGLLTQAHPRADPESPSPRVHRQHVLAQGGLAKRVWHRTYRMVRPIQLFCVPVPQDMAFETKTNP